MIKHSPYLHLTKLIGAMLSLPHSNDAIEHKFCELRVFKTDIRNCLCCSSLVSLLQTKYGLKRANKSVYELELNEQLLSALNSIESNATSEESV